MSCENNIEDARRDLNRVRSVLTVYFGDTLRAFNRLVDYYEINNTATQDARRLAETREEVANKKRAACEEENKRLHEQNTELCATVQRLQRPSYVVVPPGQTLSSILPADLGWVVEKHKLQQRLEDYKVDVAGLLGKVNGLERAVNALTEVRKGLVESKNPSPCGETVTKAKCVSIAEELARGQYDKGWNAALDKLHDTPASYAISEWRNDVGWLLTLTGVNALIKSLKKKVPC